MPRPTRHLRRLFAINQSPTRWPIALKAALAVGIPLAVATAIGHQAWGLVGNLGAFTVLYGPTQPARFRLRLLLAAGTGIVASATIGALVAPWPWLSLAVIVLMGAAGAFVCAALQLGPPGAFFFALVAGSAGNFIDRGVPLLHVLIPVAVVAAFAVVVGMSDLLFHPYGPETQAVEAAERAVGALEDIATRDNSDAAEKIRYQAAIALHKAWTTFHDSGGGARSKRAGELEQRLFAVQAAYVAHHTRRGAILAGVVNSRSLEALHAEALALLEDDRAAELREAHLGRPPASYLLRHALRWPSPELLIGARVLVGAGLAGAAATAIHSGHANWAIAFAVLMLHTGGTRVAQTLRSVQRFIGTVVGIGLYAVIALAHPQGWWLVLVLATLQFVVEELITRNYGAAVVFVTPLALLMIGSTGSAAVLAASLRDRVVDTLLCSVAAVFAVWVIGRGNTAVDLLREQLAQDAELISLILRDQVQGTQTTGSLARRQFLHYELVNTSGVETLALGDDARRAEPWTGVVAAMRGLGMLVLGMSWYPTRIGATDIYRSARDRVQVLAQALREAQPDEARDDLDRVHRKLLTAGDDS